MIKSKMGSDQFFKGLNEMDIDVLKAKTKEELISELIETLNERNEAEKNEANLRIENIRIKELLSAAIARETKWEEIYKEIVNLNESKKEPA